MAKQDFEPLLSSTIMRVVSLVPSLTQTLFDLGLSSTEVVGRTLVVYPPCTTSKRCDDSWCTKLLTWAKFGRSNQI